MKFITVKTYDELSFKGASIIAAQVIQKPNCVIGLATGSSPVGIYQNLVKWNREGTPARLKEQFAAESMDEVFRILARGAKRGE